MSGDFWQGYNGTAGGPSSYDAWQQQHLGQLSRAIEQARVPANVGSTMAPPAGDIAYGPGSGGYGPVSGKVAYVLIGLLLFPVLIFAGVIAFDRMDEQARASYQASRRSAEAQLQQRSDAQWRPILARALQGFDPAKDIEAIRDAANLSPCYGNVISSLIAGTQLGFTHCPSATPADAPLTAFVSNDRFSVSYVTPDPTMSHRVHVMALTPTTLGSGPDSGRDSPVAVAIAQFGERVVQTYLGQNCIVMDSRRAASNLPFNGGHSASREPGSFASYASLRAASIVCLTGKQLRVIATRNYRQS